MDGDAGLWKRVYLKMNEVTKWKQFKAAFLRQFGKRHTASDLMSMMHQLQQKRGEEVEKYFDRCADTILSVHEALYEEGDTEAETQALDRARNCYHGLQKEIRQDVETTVKTMKTATEMLEKAIESEAALL